MVSTKEHDLLNNIAFTVRDGIRCSVRITMALIHRRYCSTAQLNTFAAVIVMVVVMILANPVIAQTTKNAANATTMAATVSVTNALIYLPLPGQTTSAAYMEIHNSGLTAIEIDAFSSQHAHRVEMHNMEHVNGLMKMRRVPHTRINAEGTETLEPGGTHLMLFGVDSSIVMGDAVELQLHFSDGSQLQTKLNAQKR